MIKADGYGHGAEAIARLIHGYSYIWGFAVATAEEALQLRAFGVTKPILILGIVFEEYFPDMVEQEYPADCQRILHGRKAVRGGCPSGKNSTYPYWT